MQPGHDRVLQLPVPIPLTGIYSPPPYERAKLGPLAEELDPRDDLKRAAAIRIRDAKDIEARRVQQAEYNQYYKDQMIRFLITPLPTDSPLLARMPPSLAAPISVFSPPPFPEG
eukprot:gnl/Hemi2/2750_TR967_c0_g1_i1.p1 gnl/Hemi2/2750_TR967_c0_g1~~gnl/Hemi2/2750_TR967_c0_g1_i1.p1  ORF type:complete len:114 (+),score=19.45 gnl/Hemi2/2750_TR967_c0_g1_i1:82-423(+)